MNFEMGKIKTSDQAVKAVRKAKGYTRERLGKELDHRLIKDSRQVGLTAIFETDPPLIGHGAAETGRYPRYTRGTGSCLPRLKPSDIPEIQNSRSSYSSGRRKAGRRLWSGARLVRRPFCA